MKDEQKGLTSFSEAAKTPTFLISLFLAGSFVLVGVLFPEPFGEYMDLTFTWMVDSLGWSFILGGSIFLVLIVYLMLSPLGEIKLGGDYEKPAYSNMAWFAMLFSCGMGIGLLFWGVSEPIWHYMWPPHGEANTAESVHIAMRYSFFHWGFHPWAIYSVVAGSLAYFSYRKGLPMLLSSTLEPILGRKGIEGGWGVLVNTIGVLATLFGIATTLGLGVMQIGAGLEELFGFVSTPDLWVLIIVVVTILAVISTSTGIDRGIKWLSQLNLTIAALLLVLIFIVGPTLFILDIFTHSVGGYLQNLLQMSFWIDPAAEGADGWSAAWTIFYWAWWISWAPFVGSFIARVSRGRTIRSFVVGVMLAPTAVGMVWFSVFGGSALYIEHFGAAGIAELVEIDSALGFFSALSHFPYSSVLIAVAMISVAIFFITSSDSGTYVIGMLTSKGNPNPPLILRIIWGSLEGAFAAVLLLAGGLEALRTASIIGGFPFMIIMVLMLYCLLKALYIELHEESLPMERARLRATLKEIRDKAEKKEAEEQ
ncbi:choline/carnitine/betaine transporter [Methanosalsum zhilinae DSM 4017]|uniref:Choline/carnitine/betaine transporter n=1 Tax=Methanosalsum zhilinae (strain DSM 4017 / NBRC 107636 / OCM 62 / WeN5) TaxID=679901 RepID=F7XL90_METZD|nr:BCCT family transporter [Methanosalsum zhilinae]AEH60747.1 choline/carnitine/betaine transporter [Methanosalsum zhilinae DSM 4017]